MLQPWSPLGRNGFSNVGDVDGCARAIAGDAAIPVRNANAACWQQPMGSRPDTDRSAVGSSETLFLHRTTTQEEDGRNVPVGGPAE